MKIGWWCTICKKFKTQDEISAYSTEFPKCCETFMQLAFEKKELALLKQSCCPAHELSSSNSVSFGIE